MEHPVLVIGVGSIGERHLRCFGKTNRARLSFCEINMTLREQIRERYAIADAFASLDDALTTTPEAAVICAPAHLHIPMATRLASRGIHLLIEKPLSVSIDGVNSLVTLVRDRNLHASVAYVLRMHPMLAAMRNALLTGRFGTPVQLIAVAGQHFPLYRPAYRDIYYADPAQGGGAIHDALTHMVNTGEWLIGPATRLAADASHQVLDGVDVEDTVHVIARHGDVMASYSLNQHQAVNESRVTVVCSEGIVQSDFRRNRWSWAREPGADWTDEVEIAVERDDLFVAQANHFLDLIEGKASPICSLEDAVQTLRTNLAVRSAVETQAWQSIDVPKVSE